MNRPLGVTIISILFLVVGVLFLGALVVALLRPGFISALHNPDLRQDIQDAGTYRTTHLILAIFFAGIGLGLWRLQRWARWAVLLITGVGLARQIIVLLLHGVAHEAKSENSLGNYFWFATSLNAAIFLYLSLSPVKGAFTKSEIH